MFTCGQVEHVELSTMNTLHERPSAPRGGSFLIKALVNTSRQEWCLLTTLQMAIPAVAEALDAPAAQEARWIAWKSKGEAADRLTQRRTRIAFTAILVALACGTLALIML